MKYAVISLVTGLAMLASSSSVEASVFANSYTHISDFVIINDATGMPVTFGATGTGGAGGDIRIDGGSLSSSAITNINLFGMDINAVAGTLDAPVSYVDTGAGAAPADNIIFTVLPTVPGAPAGLLVAGPAEGYALADTDTDGGSAVRPVGGATSGVGVETFGEVSIDETAPVVTGNAAGTATSSSTFFTFSVSTPLTVHLDFDALVSIILDQSVTPPPFGLELIGSTSFAATLTGSGTITVGGVVTPVFTYAPAALNTEITNSSLGTVDTYSVSSGFVSPSVSLGTGTYTFSLTQGSAAAIAYVPEPLSMLTWGGLAMCGAALAYRRRRVKN